MLGSEIRELVIVKLEEHTPFGPSDGDILLAGGDSLNEVKPIYSYIDESIEEAANEILLLLPIHILSTIAVDDTSANIIATDNNTGKIQRPDDFLRLYILRMDGWVRPVHAAIKPNNPLYLLQYNEWTRGTPQKPIVTDDGKDLCYYSMNTLPHAINQFSYIQKYNDTTDYPTDVAEAIALNTARKIHEIFGNTEQAAAMQKEIESVIQINLL